MTGPGSWRLGLGGHLGSAVSALLDGQLDEESADRAWAHVHGCEECRLLVEREGWIKRRLAGVAESAPAAPTPELLGSLYHLDPAVRSAWAAVDELEHRARTRRRLGLAAAGVGSVSAVVLGVSTLTGSTLGIGGAPAEPPASVVSRPGPGPTGTVSPTGTASPVTPGPSAPSTGAGGAVPVRAIR